MKKWLVLDCNYLCHRAFHAMGHLAHGDFLTGVVYGVLRDVVKLRDDHDTPHIAFCFDSRVSLRARDYPAYKATRIVNKRTGMDEDIYKEFYRQVNELPEHLRAMGFRNIFSQEGYEADDVIGSICRELPEHEKIIIVSSDHDLYQLLSNRVMQWSPRDSKMTTYRSFVKEYGISPEQWVDVKALAGCGSDNVLGIRGIGEITAAKFLSGKLKADSKSFKLIVTNNKIWKRNLRLVRLPYPGVEVFDLRSDKKLTKSSWNKVVTKLGMKSLRNAITIRED